MTYVGEELWEKYLGGPDPDVKGFIPGKVIHIAPLNQRTALDLFTPKGVASGLLMNFLHKLGRWGFERHKVEEWLEVSPVYAPYYQITTQQKQALEGQIKSGLAQIATAISDTELLLHDLRKYREFLDYFTKVEQGKKLKGSEGERLRIEGEQTLKSIFIDQVDVHTGEGIALKLIAPRWPTVIVDFMKLSDEDKDPKKIAEKLKISEAEGVILATKNKLYQEWRMLFRQTVTERYQRLMEVVQERKKSIDEYRNMLRPYIITFRSIRMMGESEKGRAILSKVSWLRPGGAATSIEISEYWAWKPFTPPEMYKVPTKAIEGERPFSRIPFPGKFFDWVVKSGYSEEISKMELSLCPTGIEPLDDFVLEHIQKMEKWYEDKFKVHVKLTPLDILKVREDFCKSFKEMTGMGWYAYPYFCTFEIPVSNTVVRTPAGAEFEDFLIGIDDTAPLRVMMDTQNIVLLRLLEIKLKDKETENYISEMLGEKVQGMEVKEFIKGEYPLVFGERKEKPEARPEIKHVEDVNKIIRQIFGVTAAFFKPGPYEWNFKERISAPYFRELRLNYYTPAVNFFKSTIGVPGFG